MRLFFQRLRGSRLVSGVQGVIAGLIISGMIVISPYTARVDSLPDLLGNGLMNDASFVLAASADSQAPLGTYHLAVEGGLGPRQADAPVDYMSPSDGNSGGSRKFNITGSSVEAADTALLAVGRPRPGLVLLARNLAQSLEGAGGSWRGLTGTKDAYYPGSCCVKWSKYTDRQAAPPNGLPFKDMPYVLLGCEFHDPHYPTHDGQDFPVPPNTPVYSTMTGQVVFAGWNGPYGNLVVIENGDFQIWFAHLDDFGVGVAEIVARGDLIGWTGSTGMSSAPHLHYGVLYLDHGSANQYWVDPALFFDATQMLSAGC